MDDASVTQLKLIRIFRLAKLQRMVRLLRLLKLVRLMKQNRALKNLQNKFKLSSGARTLLTIFIGIVFANHLVGCFWFLLAKESGFPPNSWVVRQGIQDEETWMKYLQSIYWAF